MAQSYLGAIPPYVIVEKGDWLSTIARDYLGDVMAYKKLAAINNISNPDKIYVGQKIYLAEGGDSGSGSSSSSSNSNKATIEQFGYQTDSSGVLFATWSWDKSNTENYKVQWAYHTGDDVWFIGSDSTTEHKQSTYSIPSNATKVRFRVKPISKTYTSNNKETSYWTAEWSSYKTCTVSAITPPSIPPVPEVTMEKYKLTAELDNLDVNATKIQFKVVKNNSTTFKTGTATITTGHASYSCNVDAGGEYKVACRSYNGSEYSDWSDYSANVTTIPSAPTGITTLKATSENSVYLEWSKVTGAETYNIEYTTKKSYFDGSDQITPITGIKTTVYEKTGLETGKEYFFRVQAVNTEGESGWSEIKSVVLGKAPSAPTTWSSTTTAIRGESVLLYWVHNAEDGSNQTLAQLEINVNGKTTVYEIEKFTADAEENKTNFYELVTSGYGEGALVKWKVRTKGILNSWSEWSIQRTVEVHAPATLMLNLLAKNNGVLTDIEVVESFPIYVHAFAGPSSQLPISYHLSIVSDEVYETVDRVGNTVLINAGQEVYSKYFDITDKLECTLSAGDVDLANNIHYTAYCTVAMNSGLTAEASVPFTVSWTEVAYTPNAEISLDRETYVAHISPFCRSYTMVNYRVNQSGTRYIKTNEVLTQLYGESVTSMYTTTGERVYFGVTTNDTIVRYCQFKRSNGTTVNYKVAFNGSAYIKTSETVTLKESEDTTIRYTTTGEQVYSGTTANGNSVYYCQVEKSTTITGVSLSVYRREFDGGFTELATGLVGGKNTFVTDPHPALDYARYRIVAVANDTGAVSYCDLPGYPVGGTAAIIQWDEAWSNFDVTSEDALEEPAWAGSMLKLPYNIDVSDASAPDVELVEYIGREHPVGYYGTQRGHTSTWNVEIEADDEETLYAIRRLQNWMGNAYVREPSGSGYWASVKVSFSQKHRELTIPVTFTITRVEGGV